MADASYRSIHGLAAYLRSLSINRLLMSLVVFTVSLAAASTLAAQDKHLATQGPNLLQSSSLEIASVDKGVPKGWIQSKWGGEPTFEYDRQVGHTNPGSLKISSLTGANASWSQRVKVKRKRKYRLSGWVKTKAVDKDQGVGVVVNFHELQFDGKSAGLDGDQDWKELSIEANSGDHDSLLVNLTFGGWGNATGTAWFDDLQVVEVIDPIDREIGTITEQEAIAFYNTKVRPILKENCFECHADDPEDLQGGFAITSHASIMRGGESGPAVDEENLRDSVLLMAVNYDVYEMPPSGKLSAKEIATLTRWVKLGTPFDPADERDLTADVEASSKVPQVNEETKSFWSFQPVVTPSLPAVKQATWVANPIDAFILKRLEDNNFAPAAAASKEKLIRRAYYDLTGLPPSPEQVQAFVDNNNPDAYSQLIDQLLASPHYGEKWGRHWLDLVRYAESNSFERDGTKPFVWRYRDYVIRAFNNDKPYDRFLTEQLAGDEIKDVTAESITATGYYRLGAWDDEPADKLLAKYDDLDDIVGTTSQTMMGLTVNCARCHDHKIDPIPQADYYRLASMFENIRRYGVRSNDTVFAASVRNVPGEATETQKADYQKALARVDTAMEQIVELARPDFQSVEHEDFQYEMNKLAILKKRVGNQITQKQFNRFRGLMNERATLLKNPPGSVNVLCVKERGSQVEDSFVRVRGNPHVVGEKVEPGFISVLSPPEPEIVSVENSETSGRRLAVAKWLVAPQHPLTSRVMVNRIWQFHFGRGIVRTASDFGFQGSQPTHPELLDWLANEFIERKWSIKSMHRLIMNSNAYKMSSDYNSAANAVDPENDLFWRFNLRRLTAEEIRDSILDVTGDLNREKMFGPSIFPTMPPEVLAGQSRPGEGWKNSSEEDKRRRSVYVHVKRSLALPILSTHDSADTDNTCPVRFITTQPTQALGMLNSKFTNDQAKRFAAMIESQQLKTKEQKVIAILERVTQRKPNKMEIERGIGVINAWQAKDGVDESQALEYFCLLALNLNEFVYVD